ncbi:MAG: tol-pal system protein YbgF [Alphaproteobacteria bacterium]|nr:tol-pal system protein YbgF [Alphaproteobacteria bacterium]
MPLSTLSPPMLRAAALATLAVGLVATAPTMAVAQDDLAREVELLKRDLSDLQRFIYRGEGQPPAPAAAPPPAPSATAEPLPTDVAGRLQVKMQRLEREMRDLTGRVEEAEFRARQAEQRLETYAADLEYRLQRIEQSAGLSVGSGGAPAAATGGAPVALGQPANAGQAGAAPGAEAPGTTVITSAGASQDGALTDGAPAEGALGVLRTNAAGEVIGAEMAALPAAADSEGQAAAEPPSSQAASQVAPQAAPQPPPAPGAVGEAATTAAAPTAALPEGAPEAQYEYAFSLLRKRDFPAAEAAMRGFVDRHGDHQLAGNAMYWLGETFYARENYRDAAATFLDAYTGYPSNDKASHSLLKLAMSLGALGKTDAACQAFATLSQDGSASQRILATGESEAAKLGCP